MLAAAFGAPPGPRMNVVLITPDQLRADHISCYGHPRATSPNMDRLASEGTLFTRHYAVGSWTTPTFVSMLTSLVPSRHGATLFGSRMYDPSTRLFPQRFVEAGYKTVAFCNNGNATKPLMDEGSNSAIRGFSELHLGEVELPRNITEHSALNAEHTTDGAVKWLEENGAHPFFMWLLYIEPHSPYNPPPEDDIFKTSAYPDELNDGYTPERGKGHLYRLANAGDKDARQRLVDLYDGKIHFVDRHVGAILDKLDALGLADQTLVVLTSDHGELLYEHDDCLTFDHRSLYDADTYVPLIVRGSAVPSATRIDALVNQLDIAPSVLDLAGLPPLDGAQGRSVRPLLTGARGSIHEHLFAEQDVLEPLRSVRDGRHKLIYRTSDGRRLLFDTENDPCEQHNVAEERADVANRLLAALDDYSRRNAPDATQRQAHFARFCPENAEIDEVTIGSRLQFYGMKYDALSTYVKMADGKSHRGGACYWMKPGDGSYGALWRSGNPLIGDYAVFIWYGKLSGTQAASNVQVTVRSAGGVSIVSVDQNRNCSKWKPLGTFTDPVSVSVSDKADGAVIIDAVRFERTKTDGGAES